MLLDCIPHKDLLRGLRVELGLVLSQGCGEVVELLKRLRLLSGHRCALRCQALLDLFLARERLCLQTCQGCRRGFLLHGLGSNMLCQADVVGGDTRGARLEALGCRGLESHEFLQCNCLLLELQHSLLVLC